VLTSWINAVFDKLLTSQLTYPTYQSSPVQLSVLSAAAPWSPVFVNWFYLRIWQCFIQPPDHWWGNKDCWGEAM